MPSTQIPVKVDLRKINTPERLERLAKARQIRAANRILREEKRMELAKQMILASAGVPEKTASKMTPEDKKLKWEARKNEIFEEFSKTFAEANALAMKKPKEPEPDSEFSDMEEPPAKRQKKPKKSKSAVAKPKSANKSSSSTGPNAYERDTKRRKPVPPAVPSEEECSGTESNGSSDVEQDHVLKL